MRGTSEWDASCSGRFEAPTFATKTMYTVLDGGAEEIEQPKKKSVHFRLDRNISYEPEWACGNSQPGTSGGRRRTVVHTGAKEWTKSRDKDDTIECRGSASQRVIRSLPLFAIAAALLLFAAVILGGGIQQNNRSYLLSEEEAACAMRNARGSCTQRRHEPLVGARAKWKRGAAATAFRGILFANAQVTMNEGERQEKQDAFESDMETTLLIETRNPETPTDDAGEYDCTYAELADTTSSKQCAFAKTYATTTTTTLTAQGVRTDGELGRFFMSSFGLNAIDTINLKYYTFVPNAAPYNGTDIYTEPKFAGTLRKVDIRTGEQMSIGGSIDAPFPYTPVAMTYDLLGESLLMLVSDYETDYDVSGVLTLISIDVDTGALKMNDNTAVDDRYNGGTFVSFCKACEGSPSTLSGGVVSEFMYDYTSSLLGYLTIDAYDQTVYTVLYDPEYPDESKTLFAVKRPRNVDVEDYVVDIDWDKFRNYEWPKSCTSISKLEFIPRDVRSQTFEAAVLYFPTGKPKSLGAIANINDYGDYDICANKPCGAQISDLEYAKFIETFDGEVNPISYVDGRAHCRCDSAAVRIHIDMEANYTSIVTDATNGLMKLGNAYWDGTDSEYSIMRTLISKSSNVTTNDKDVASIYDGLSMDISTVKASTGTEGAEIFGGQYNSASGSESMELYSLGYQGQDESATQCTGDDCLQPPNIAVLGSLTRDHFPTLLQHDRDFSKTVEYKITLLKDLPTVATKSFADNLNGIDAGETVCTVKPELTCATCQTDDVNTFDISETETITYADYFATYGTCPVPCDEYDCSKNECMIYADTPCGAIVSAGAEILLDVRAFTVFGLPPKSMNDNFTVTITETNVGGDEVNVLGLPTDAIVLGPVFRDLGESGTLAGGIDASLKLVTVDTLADFPYPNVMDLAYNATTGSFVDGCRNDDGSNRCTRYLVRPWFTGTRGSYRTKFALDKAGSYEVVVTERGELTYEEDELKDIRYYVPEGTPLLGANLAGAPYNLTVIPADPVSSLSVISGAGVSDATIGTVSEFLIAMSDRFGNRITDDRKPIIEVSLRGAGDVVQCSSTTETVESETAAWCGIDYAGDGYYRTQYFLVTRSKLTPVYDLTIDIGGVSVLNPAADPTDTRSSIFDVAVANSVSDAGNSFTIAPVGATDGRTTADVGVEVSFGVQARDAFGNLQDSSEQEGNYFSVNVTDAMGSVAIAYSVSTIESSTEQASSDFLAPEASIVDLGDGQYSVSYSVFKAGTAYVSVYFNGELIGTSESVVESGKPPHVVDVSPGAIKAAMSLAIGNGTESLVAGTEAQFEIIFRDEYNNDVRSQGSASVFSSSQSAKHTLITECEDGVYPCDVVTREYDGMTILEIPNEDLGLYDGQFVAPTNGYTAAFSQSTQQLFVTYTLPLAGLYDFEIKLTETDGDADGLNVVGASEFIAISGSPYRVTAIASETSYLFSELFFVEYPTDVNDDGELVYLDPVFHSSLQHVTHTFEDSNGVEAKPDFGDTFLLSATAGLKTNAFYIQARDAKGNLITTESVAPSVIITGPNGYEVYVVGEDDASAAPQVSYAGQGAYLVTYGPTYTGIHTVAISVGDGEVLRVRYDDELAELVYEDRFTIDVSPQPASAAKSTAGQPGTGLIGGIVNEDFQFTLYAKDPNGNLELESTAASASFFKVYFRNCGNPTSTEGAEFEAFKDACRSNARIDVDEATDQVEVTSITPGTSGYYAVSFVPKVVAYLKVEIDYGDVQMTSMEENGSGRGLDDIFIKVKSGADPPVASATQLISIDAQTGVYSGGTVGELQVAYAQAYDQDGLPVGFISGSEMSASEGPIDINAEHVILTHTDGTQVVATGASHMGSDAGDDDYGKYELSFAEESVTKDGDYSLGLQVSNTDYFALNEYGVSTDLLYDIANNGRTITMLPGISDASRIQVSVAGSEEASSSLSSVSIVAGDSVTFTIKAFDKYGNEQIYMHPSLIDIITVVYEEAVTLTQTTYQTNVTATPEAYSLSGFPFYRVTYSVTISTTVATTAAANHKLYFYIADGSTETAISNENNFVTPESGDAYLPLSVSPSEVYVPFCAAQFTSTEFVVGDIVSFTILEYDKYGNRRTDLLESSIFDVTVNFDSVDVDEGLVANSETVTYFFDPIINPLHFVSFSAGFRSADMSTYVSGYYNITIGDVNGNFIANSGKQITVDAGTLSLDTSVVYGQGIIFDYLITGTAGTNKVGYPNTVIVEGRDSYGNRKMFGGDEFTLALTPIGNEKPLSTTSIDHGNGTYTISYAPSTTGSFALTVERAGEFFSFNRYFYSECTYAPCPTSELKSVLSSEGSQRIVAQDASIATGVLTTFLPGPLSATYSFASGELIGKSGSTVIIDAQTDLDFSVYALDIQNSNKVDDDPDRFVDVKIEYIGEEDGTMNDPSTARLTYEVGPGSMGGDAYFATVNVTRDDVDLHIFTVDDPFAFAPETAGFYRIWCNVTYFTDFSNGTRIYTDTEVMGSGETLGPYVLEVKAAESSGEDSALSGIGGSNRRRSSHRRALLSTADEATLVVVEAGTRFEGGIELKDRFNNAQKFDKLRQLDIIEVRVGEETFNGTSACVWDTNTRPPTIDVDASEVGCTAVHTGLAPGFNRTLAYADPTTTLDGLGLNAFSRNHYENASFGFAFTPDAQLPALADTFYRLSILMNDSPLPGTPLRLRVDAGPTNGYFCDLDPDFDEMEPEVGVQSRFTLNARDKFRNMQTNGMDESEMFHIMMKIDAPDARGSLLQGSIGCTKHASCAHCDACDFEITLAPHGGELNGKYDVTFTPTVATYDIPYSLAISYCPNGLEVCTEKDLIHNHLESDETTTEHKALSLHVSPGPSVLSQAIFRGHSVRTQVALTGGHDADHLVGFAPRDRFNNVVPHGPGDVFGAASSIYGAPMSTSLYGGTYASSSLYGASSSTSAVVFGNVTFSFSLTSPDGSESSLVPFYDATEMLSYVTLRFDAPGRHVLAVTDGTGASLTREIVAVETQGKLSIRDSIVLSHALGTEEVSHLDIDAGQEFLVYVQTFRCRHSYETSMSSCEENQSGGDKFRAILTSSDVLGDLAYHIDAIDGADMNARGMVSGMYGILLEAYTVLQSGHYELRIEGCALNDDGSGCETDADFSAIKHTAISVTVVPGSPSTRLSSISFLDSGTWMAGDILSGELVFKDDYGNHVAEPDGIFKRHPVNIQLNGPQEIILTEVFPPSCSVADLTATLELGTYALCRSGLDYSVKFRVKEATFFSLEVVLYDVFLQGSFLIHLTRPNLVYPPNCIITSGLTSFDAGLESYIEIRLRDAYDNLVFESPTNLNYFEVSYEMIAPFDTASEAGVGDNPLRLTGNTEVQLEYVAGGEDYAYGESWWQFAETGSTVKMYVWLQDLRDGTLYATINSMRAGLSRLAITARDSVSEEMPICSTAGARALCESQMAFTSSDTSTFDVTVLTGAPDPAESYAYSNSKALQVTTAAEVSEIRIVAYDIYRNLITADGYSFTVLLRSDATGEILSGDTEYTETPDVNAPSYYKATYEARVSGPYTLFVMRKGNSLLGRLTDDSGIATISRGPFAIDVIAGETYAPNVVVDHAFEQRNATDVTRQFVAVSGEVVTFKITAYDFYGNRKTVGNDKFSVLINDTIEGLTVDNQDGTYDVSYTLYNAGTSYMVISVNKQTVSLPSSSYDVILDAFPVEVQASATDPDMSSASGRRLTAANAGAASGFTVAVRDKYSNLQDHGKDKVLAVITRNVENATDVDDSSDDDATSDARRRRLLQSQDSFYGVPLSDLTASDSNTTEPTVNVTNITVDYLLDIEHVTDPFVSGITNTTATYVTSIDETASVTSAATLQMPYLTSVNATADAYTVQIAELTSTYIDALTVFNGTMIASNSTSSAPYVITNTTTAVFDNITSTFVANIERVTEAYAIALADVNATDVASLVSVTNSTGMSFIESLTSYSSSYVHDITMAAEKLLNDTSIESAVLPVSENYLDISGITSYVPVTFESTGTGYYIGSYSITEDGTYSMLITVDDVLIYNTTSLVVSPGAVSDRSFADVAHLNGQVVRTAQTFYVYPLDEYGNHVLTGSSAPNTRDTLTVDMYSLQGDRASFTKVTIDTTIALVLCPSSTEKWCWQVDFTSSVAGDLYIYTSINENMLMSSPDIITVFAAETGIETGSTSQASARDCQASASAGGCTQLIGRGLRGLSTDVSVGTDFFIDARDIYGNKQTSGNDTFAVHFQGPSPSTTVFSSPEYATVTYAGDGSYRVLPRLINAGTYALTVMLEVNGTSYPVFVNSTEISVHDTTKAEYAELARTSRDANMTEVGGVGASVAVVGESNTLTLATRVRESTGRRRSLTSDTATTITDVWAGGADIALSMLVANTNGSFVEATADAFTYNATDNNDGTYTLEYNVSTVGTFLLNATVNGDPVATGGISATAYPGSLPSANVTVVSSSLAPSGNATTPTVGMAGTLVGHTIRPADAAGNLMSVHPWQLKPLTLRGSVHYLSGVLSEDEASILASSEKITYYSGDNSYKFSYRPVKDGTYTTQLVLGGVELEGEPVDTISAGAVSGSSSEVYGMIDGRETTAAEGVTAASAYQTMYLYLRLYDRYGNRVLRTTEGHLIQAEAVNTLANVDTSVTSAESMGDHYRLNMTLPVTGTYHFSIRVNGELVKEFTDSTETFTATVTKVAADPSKCEILREAATLKTLAETPNYFQVQSKDKDGIIKTGTDGEDVVVARFEPAIETNSFGVALTSHTASVTEDSTTGIYTVSYSIIETGNYTMSLSINGSPIPGKYQSEVFQVLPRFSPLQTDALMSETVTQLAIEFQDQDGFPYNTDRGGLVGLDDCAKILTNETLAFLGSGPKCTFTRADRLVIFLGFAANVLPNDLITFLPEKIFSLNKNSKSVAGSSKVIRPPIAPAPKLVLRAPVKLGVCEDLVLDTSGSYGTAGRTLNYEYGMFPNVPNEKNVSLILRDATERNVDRIVIENAMLYADTPYIFNVRVRNFLGEAMTMQHTVTRRNFSVPQIMIEGENVIRTNVHKPLHIMASVKLPIGDNLPAECTVPYPEMDFSWSLDPYLSTDEFTLDPKTEHSRRLYVPAYSMKAGHLYTLNIHGEIDHRPELSNEATAFVLAEYSSIIAKVKAPSKIREGAQLVLNATSSFDPDDPLKLARDEFGPFEFRWSCTKTGGAACFDDDSFLYQSPVVPSLTISGDKLAVGEYTFVINVLKEPLYDAIGPIAGRRNSITKTIIVEAASAGSQNSSSPDVHIVPLGKSVVNSNEKLTLETELVKLTGAMNTTTAATGNMTTMTPTPIYYWTVEEGDLDLDRYPELVATPRTSSHLSIRKNALGGGNNYRLRVTTKNPMTNETSFDEVSFGVNNPPSSGSFSVSPAEGYAGETTYALTCNNWEDDSGEPVLYEFRYVNPTTGDEVPLRALTKDNIVETIIPPVSLPEEQHELTLVAYVQDKDHAKIRVTSPVIAYPPRVKPAKATFEYNGSNITTTGPAAFNNGLIEGTLRYANGTNDVASLITVATSILFINNEEKERMRMSVFPLTDDELRDAEVATGQLSHVLNVLKRAMGHTHVTKEEIDAFGVVYKEATANMDDDNDGGKGDAINAIDELTGSALEQGMDEVASQSLLDSIGTISLKSQGAVLSNATAVARRHLLQTASDASASSATAPGIDEATSQRVQNIANALGTAGLKEHVSGEDPFAVATAGLQVAAKRASNVAGLLQAPVAPGGNATSQTSFTLPGDMSSDDDEAVDMVLMTNQNDPFAYANDGTRLESDVSTFEIKAKNALSANNVTGLTTPIKIHIPISGREGSSCRVTQGGCRYFDEQRREWSTDGMLERRRTESFIECETVHLSSFGLSSDDVMPEVTIVNPINAADLFSNISVDNMLAIFVVGCLLVIFAFANVIGYRLDVRDRANEKIRQRVEFLNTRLNEAKESAAGLKAKKNARKTGDPSDKYREDDVEYSEQMASAIKSNHVLANVIFVKPNDPYTRPQRLTVLLVVILGNICVAAIFFNAEPGNVMAKIYVGVMTAVLLFPTKIVFKILFKTSIVTKKERKQARRPEKIRVLRQARMARLERIREEEEAEAASAAAAAAAAVADAETMRRRASLPGVANADADGITEESIEETGVKIDMANAGMVPRPPPGQRRKPRPGDSRSRRADGLSVALGNVDPPPMHEKVHRPRVSRRVTFTQQPGTGAMGELSSPSPPRRSAGVPPDAAGRTLGETLFPPTPTKSPFGLEPLFPGDAVTVPSPSPLPVKRPNVRRTRADLLAIIAAGAIAQGSGGSPFASPNKAADQTAGNATSTSDSGGGSAPGNNSTPPSVDPPPAPEAGANPPRLSRRRSSLSSRNVAIPVTTSPVASYIKGKSLVRPRVSSLLSGASTSGTADGASTSSSTAIGALVSKSSVREMIRQQELAQGMKSNVSVPGLTFAPETVDVVPDEVVKAALMIQRAFRAKRARREAKLEGAAVAIQSAWRGLKARMKVRKIVQDREERRAGTGSRPTSAASRASSFAEQNGLWWVTAHTSARPGGTGGGGAQRGQFAALIDQARSERENEQQLARVRGGDDDDDALRRSSRRRRRRRKNGHRKGKRNATRGLPRWCIYLVYAGAFLFCAIASLMICLYGLTFEPSIGRAWLLSSMLSIFVEFFVQDPLRVCALATITKKFRKGGIM